MVKDSLSHFFDDIRAALLVRVPIRLERNKATELSVSKLEDFRRQLAAEVKKGNSIDSLKSCGDVPSSILAALAIYDKTGSASALLDGLVARNVANARLLTATRWPMIYLCLLMLFAALGLVLFSREAVPLIQDLHQDLFFKAYESPKEDYFGFSARLVQISAGLMVAISLWLFLGGARKLVMWMGGRDFIAINIVYSAVTIIQKLTKSGVSNSRACELAEQLLDTSRHETELIAISANRLFSDGDLAMEQSLLNQQSQNGLNKLSLSTPTVLIAVFGGLLTLMYCFVLFSPMIVLLTETLKSGVDG